MIAIIIISSHLSMTKKHVLSFIISVALIVLLLSYVDFSQMITALLHVDTSFYVTAFLLYTTSYLLRALRLHMLFQTNSLDQYFLIVAGHMLLNHIFPFRTGEISLPFFLKRVTNISYSQSISLFALLRLFDVFAVMITCFMTISLGKVTFSVLVAVFTIFSSLLCLVCILNLKKILLKMSMFLTHISPRKYIQQINTFAEYISSALTLPYTVYLKLFFLSFFDRLCNYGVTIFLVIGMSFNISILPLIIANAIASLSNIIPINSFGSFGTLELGWTGALMFYGIPKDIAISSGFSFHLLCFTYTISLGLFSLLMMKIACNINPLSSMHD